MEKLLPGENSQGFHVRQATSSGEGGEAKVLKKGGRQITEWHGQRAMWPRRQARLKLSKVRTRAFMSM